MNDANQNAKQDDIIHCSLGEHSHWDISLLTNFKTGEKIVSAYLETLGYPRSGQVFEARVPDGTATAQMTAREGLAIIAAADQVAIGGSYFGHAPEWKNTDLHRAHLESALR